MLQLYSINAIQTINFNQSRMFFAGFWKATNFWSNASIIGHWTTVQKFIILDISSNSYSEILCLGPTIFAHADVSPIVHWLFTHNYCQEISNILTKLS